jgi:hypothetical protein
MGVYLNGTAKLCMHFHVSDANIRLVWCPFKILQWNSAILKCNSYLETSGGISYDPNVNVVHFFNTSVN